MDEEDQDRNLRMSLPRKREILFALAWRGMLYSFFSLIIAACCTYLFAETAWQFFLSSNLKLNYGQTAYLYVFMALPAMLIGWIVAAHHVLHQRFSHFRISLIASPPRRTLYDALFGDHKRRKSRHYRSDD